MKRQINTYEYNRQFPKILIQWKRHRWNDEDNDHEKSKCTDNDTYADTYKLQ